MNTEVDLKAISLAAMERHALGIITVSAGALAKLTADTAELVAAMQPTDPCYLDIQDAHKSYSSTQTMQPVTRVTVQSGKVLQLCQLLAGEPLTPLPAKYSLDKPASAGPGKLAKDAAEAQQALAEKLAKDNAEQVDAGGNDPPDPDTEVE